MNICLALADGFVDASSYHRHRRQTNQFQVNGRVSVFRGTAYENQDLPFPRQENTIPAYAGPLNDPLAGGFNSGFGLNNGALGTDLATDNGFHRDFTHGLSSDGYVTDIDPNANNNGLSPFQVQQDQRNAAALTNFRGNAASSSQRMCIVDPNCQGNDPYWCSSYVRQFMSGQQGTFGGRQYNPSTPMQPPSQVRLSGDLRSVRPRFRARAWRCRALFFEQTTAAAIRCEVQDADR